MPAYKGLLAAALVATASAAAVRAADDTPGRPPPATAASASESTELVRYAVAAMGDSLTDPRSHGGKYLEHLRERCPESRFDSYGVGGNMVNQMRKRFARDLFGEGADEQGDAKPRYTHLLLLGGINDICSDETAKRTNDKIKADLAWMYASARDRGVAVVALTLPPWGGFARYYNRRRATSTFELNHWIKLQLDDGKVDAVVDIFPQLSCGDPEMLCEPYGWPDRVHWSKKGHEVVGKILHAQLFSDCR
jgi:lysophospholipase L1-like esterase